MRQDGHGLHAAVDVALQLDDDVVPPGEGGDDEQPDPARVQQFGDVEALGAGEHGVHPALLVGGHAEPAVLDLDRESGRHPLGAQQDLGPRRGELGRVLHEFGQQVHDVGDGVAAYGALDGGHQPDPRVVLDLRDAGTQHLGDADRAAPLAAGDRAAEDGEVLGVAPDTGGQVVEVEQALQQFGVLDLGLQLVEVLDLPVDEGLHAAGEVHEDLDPLVAAARRGRPGGGLEDGRLGGVPGRRDLAAEPVEGILAGDGRRGSVRWPDAFAALDLGEQRLEFDAPLGGLSAQRGEPGGERPAAGGGDGGGDGEHRGGEAGGSGQDAPQEPVAAVRAGAPLVAQDVRHGGGGDDGDQRGGDHREPRQVVPGAARPARRPARGSPAVAEGARPGAELLWPRCPHQAGPIRRAKLCVRQRYGSTGRRTGIVPAFATLRHLPMSE